MSKPNPVDLIAESEARFEAEDTETAEPATSVPSQPNRAKSVVYSIRLNPAEVQRLEELADATGIPASTLAAGTSSKESPRRPATTYAPHSSGSSEISWR